MNAPKKGKSKWKKTRRSDMERKKYSPARVYTSLELTQNTHVMPISSRIVNRNHQKESAVVQSWMKFTAKIHDKNVMFNNDKPRPKFFFGADVPITGLLYSATFEYILFIRNENVINILSFYMDFSFSISFSLVFRATNA